MKNVKKFNKFCKEELNEWLGQKFITGHGSGEKENAKLRIEGEIENCIDQYENNPTEFIKYDQNNLRARLEKEAKEDNYRGKVKIITSPNDYKTRNSNKKFIEYQPEKSGLQELGSIAAKYR